MSAEKTIRTTYIEIELLRLAKVRGINISDFLNEQLRTVLLNTIIKSDENEVDKELFDISKRQAELLAIKKVNEQLENIKKKEELERKKKLLASFNL
jgi:hypothetical protein